MEAVADPPASRTELENGAPDPLAENQEERTEPDTSPGHQYTFDVGGEPATSSSLRLTGGKLEISGEFFKGERVTVQIECVISQVAFVDKVDGKTGQVTGCERRQSARIDGVTVL